MTRILYCGSSSACFEIDHTSPYYSQAAYTVLLNNKEYLQGKTNVFSVFDLLPDTEYSVQVRFSSGEEDTVALKTLPESCCVSIKEFGAVGDGVHDDTTAIQTAIDFLPEGGRLYFPEGVYLTLPLSLKSCMTLDLSEGAVILGSPDRSRYPIVPAVGHDMLTGREIPLVGFEGLEQDCYQSLLHGSYMHDIRIVGKGKIDGNGQSGDWWRDFRSFPAARPNVLFLNRCSHVTVHGVSISNGPAWHMHPYFTKDFSLLDCFVSAPKDSPNTDGIDPESCDGVNIIGCRFSVGDDCIAIKSGKIDMAKKYKAPAANPVIRNCLMEFGHGAVTLGSELGAGMRKLHVTQCCFYATDRGLRIKSRRGRGKDSVVTDVVFDNIRMDKVLTPIVINMWYNCCDPDRYTEYVWSREHLPVDDRTPHLGSFAFRNMECTGAEVAACYIDGLPESPLDDVTLENITVSFADDAKPGTPAMKNFATEHCRLGLYLDNVKTIEIRNVKLDGVVGKNLIAEHYENIVAEGFEVE